MNNANLPDRDRLREIIKLIIEAAETLDDNDFAIFLGVLLDWANDALFQFERSEIAELDGNNLHILDQV